MRQFKELEQQKVFKDISDVADRLGYPCYVVGGFVRDLLLGIPNDDIDVVVVGSGLEIAKEYHKKVGGKLSVFENFGTADVVDPDGLEVQFVGARKESYERGSRKPICENGTLTDDLGRRDFTINAMAICLNKNEFGNLVDLFSGLGDLERKLIRTPIAPSTTFNDDPLRMLRCIRFAVKLGFEIDQPTWRGIVMNAGRLGIISMERIIEEMNKIMMSPDPKRGVLLLHQSGLLKQFLPEVSVLDTNDKEVGGTWHKNNFWHSINVLQNVAERSDNLWLRWGALLHDIGKEPCKRYDPIYGWTFQDHDHAGARMIPGIFRRLQLPLDERMTYVQKLVDMHMRPQNIANAGEDVTDSAVRRLCNDFGENVGDLMTLCESDLTTKNEAKKQAFINNFQRVREMIEDLKERDFVRLFQPCIGGNDIMEILHLKPGKLVGELKQYLKDAILDGKVPNEYDALLNLLMERAKELGI